MKRFSFSKVILLLFLVVCISGAETRRPKIGLVLSGGGARGFAHIGVLQVLDSLKVPIDFIAGTSIGAIVGGLYSIGYSPREIEEIAVNTDWPEVFSDSPRRTRLSYFEKQETGRFQLSFKLNKYRLEPPSGLIYGQKVSLLLSRLTLPYSGTIDFDRLPIPFRCVAADLITGSEVILHDGSLARAIRASMSVPSIFSPVSWGDSLLVDGGVVNNCPVDVARDMGAETLIAVNVGTPKRSREQLNNGLAILLQAFNLAGYQREQENLADADVVITPNLKNYSNTDFFKEKVLEMIRVGRRTARLHIAEVAQFESDHSAEKHLRPLTPPANAIIYGIRIEGNRRLPFSFIYQNLGIRPGEPLDVALLENRIEHLYSLGYFQILTYRIEEKTPSAFLVYLQVTEKPKRLFRLGVKYQEDKQLIAALNLKLNDFPVAGFRTDITYHFSGQQILEMEISYPRRFFHTQFFPYLYSYYRDIPINIFVRRQRIARYHNRSYGSAAGLGLVIHNWAMLKAEYNLERLRVEPSIAIPQIVEWPEWKYNVHYGRLFLEIDLLDNPLIPAHGYRGRFEYVKTLEFIRQRENYQRMFTRHSFYGTFLPRTTTGLHLIAGFNENVKIYRWYYLGGPDSFVGMNYDEFGAANVLVGRLENRVQLSRWINLLGIVDVGYRWDEAETVKLDNSPNKGFGVGVEVNTIAGPLRYVIGINEGRQLSYFTLGFTLALHYDERQ